MTLLFSRLFWGVVPSLLFVYKESLSRENLFLDGFFFQTRMFLIPRHLALFRSLSSARFFSLSRISRAADETQQHPLLPVDRQLPALSRLPSYLPAPTGVPSKLFDQFYLIYRLGFHQPLRFIQMIKVAQALAT